MAGEDDLLAGIAYMKEHCEKIGRADIPEIVLGSVISPEKCSPQMLMDRIGHYRELGVTAAGMHIDGHTRAEWCDNVRRFGEDVIAKISA